MFKKLFDKFADWLIQRSFNTPYLHLEGYMERFWVFRFFPYTGVNDGHTHWNFAGRIHHIMRSDRDRTFHDHPWWYLTIILKGGYTEVTPIYDKSGMYQGERRKFYGPGSILLRRAQSWHRLELDSTLNEFGGGAWTFFITFKKVQEWGFVKEPDNKIHHTQYDYDV